jgi:inosose dehydratase
VPASASLNKDEWKTFAAGANKVARAVYDATGLRTVFHHHSAGYVETPDEIATLLELTDADKLGIVFDSGHYLNGAGVDDVDLVAALNRFKDRIWYIHLKDISPEVAHQVRTQEWDYFNAVRSGLFCELGKGAVDFPALLRWLAEQDYKGYTLVEQDVLPGMGHPKESAARNREYLRSIESNFTDNQPILEIAGAR